MLDTLNLHSVMCQLHLNKATCVYVCVCVCVCVNSTTIGILPTKTHNLQKANQVTVSHNEIQPKVGNGHPSHLCRHATE